jgi:GNAT superfamily N-acetyltransferase
MRIQPGTIFVRPANQGDIDALIAFSLAMAWETEGRRLNEERLRQGTLAVLADPERGFYIVADIRDGDRPRPVGQLLITFEWSDWRNGVFWWVQSVYVAPVCRRQGVYRAMHDYIIARAKADTKICGVRLYVEQNNRVAQSVYRRVGLAPSGYAVYEQDFVLASRPASPGDRPRPREEIS